MQISIYELEKQYVNSKKISVIVKYIPSFSQPLKCHLASSRGAGTPGWEPLLYLHTHS
jgi:hypothetical protein